MEESLDVLGGVRLFFTIDLASAHNQVEVAPEDRHKTAFSTPFRLCEYNRMPFGLRSMPRMFQRIMLTIFCDELLEILIVYLDDIIQPRRQYPPEVLRNGVSEVARAWTEDLG